MSKQMPKDLENRFNFLRKNAKDRYDKATSAEEKASISKEIDSLEEVYKAYYYSYDMMEALS